MCNDYRYRLPVERLIEEFAHLRIPLRFPAGVPNIEPKDDIKITDRAPVVRPDGDGARLDMLRWSWPSPMGAPVYNFRSEGRRFDVGQRALAICDGFYEFTPSPDPKAKRKLKWLFTMPETPIFAIAAVWRPGAADGADAWSMLTTEPGEDVAPFHGRQVVVLPPRLWRPWLEGESEADLLRPLPAGSLKTDPASSPAAG